MTIDDIFIQIVEKYNIPLLTKDYIGKTVAKINKDGFIIFTDNTCVLLDSDGFCCDQDEFHPITYLEYWKRKYPNAVTEFKNLMGV